MAVTMLVGLVVIDVVVVVCLSVVIGATAPRWPGSWLTKDRFPLRLGPWETAAFYRRLGVVALARRLPELGDTFGGQSKSALPGRTPEALAGYLAEVRRAEWVHWLSAVGSCLVFTFNPWWLAAAFVAATTLGNLPFILVLRNNRRRLLAITSRGGQRA
jgi:hypothetical protein